MQYLNKLYLPNAKQEDIWLRNDPTQKYYYNNVYLSLYPFNFFTRFQHAPEFEFSDITILYGGNGSGKSTVLNLLATKLKLTQKIPV